MCADVRLLLSAWQKPFYQQRLAAGHLLEEETLLEHQASSVSSLRVDTHLVFTSFVCSPTLQVSSLKLKQPWEFIFMHPAKLVFHL